MRQGHDGTEIVGQGTQPDAARQIRAAYGTEFHVNWIKRFILFYDKRHPETMGLREVELFLTHPAVEGKVAASTQNQALSAIYFSSILDINSSTVVIKGHVSFPG